MNCEQFKDIAGELATHRLIDVATRDEARAHAFTCAPCADDLNRTQTTMRLLQLASSAEVEEAPARVKTSIIAAFKNQPQFELPLARKAEPKRLRWWIPAAAGVAAMILLGVLIVSTFDRAKPGSSSTTAVDQPKQIDSTKQTALPAPAASPLKSSIATVRQDISIKKSRPKMSVSNSASAAVRTEPKTTSDTKTTSSYLPLTYLASATAMESGTVVRVELTRATLLSLGLPVNIDGAAERFKAELVVGDDGVVRAIRLIE